VLGGLEDDHLSLVRLRLDLEEGRGEGGREGGREDRMGARQQKRWMGGRETW
jgi:hypothetical protein